MQRIGEVYIAPSAVVEGDVVLGARCNIWHHCVLRGDVAPIRLGARVNVQDGSILHCRRGVALEIADDVAIGHQAIVHCRSVGSGTLIGIRATVLDDCEIGEHCLIAAGAVVPPGTRVPDGSVVMGLPGRVVRPVRDEERAYIARIVEGYQQLAEAHAEGLYPKYGDPSREVEG
jgi:carbonic anhydrase/acetyltransferase-like protein (isoleucine patch superfamily)